MRHAPARLYLGHSAHVTGVKFLADDQRLISVGGRDRAVFQWRTLGIPMPPLSATRQSFGQTASTPTETYRLSSKIDSTSIATWGASDISASSRFGMSSEEVISMNENTISVQSAQLADSQTEIDALRAELAKVKVREQEQIRNLETENHLLKRENSHHEQALKTLQKVNEEAQMREFRQVREQNQGGPAIQDGSGSSVDHASNANTSPSDPVVAASAPPQSASAAVATAATPENDQPLVTTASGNVQSTSPDPVEGSTVGETIIPRELKLRVVKAEQLADADHGWFDGDSDPKVSLTVLASDGTASGDTQTTSVSKIAKWDEDFVLPVPEGGGWSLRAEVFDQDENSADDPLGFVVLKMDEIHSRGKVDVTFPLEGVPDGKRRSTLTLRFA